ncbi:hypothetical protein R3751_14995 [Halorubrum distributum]|uniref:hypothetical protein n=1 Tax=Halorubrum distributum TaxID=29283 RepID=UPI002954D2B2|nr:hypothetical protein [Halorubrum distributum]MDV7351080.1 hypothetical protein [Halorubrum distributum]
MTASRLIRGLVALVVVTSAMVSGVTVVAANGPAVNVSSVNVTPTDPTVGETVTVEVTISNQEGSNSIVDVSSIMLRTTSEHYERVEDVGAIAPGGSLTVPITTSFDTAGEKNLLAHVSAASQSNGSETSHLRAYYRPITIDVEAPEIDAGIAASTNSSGETTVTLTNYGNVELTDAEIRASVNGTQRDQRDTFDITPNQSESVTFDTANYDSDIVTLTGAYTARGERHEVTRTVDLNQQVQGEIRLTSVEVAERGTTISIDGEAANIGGTDVESVLVRVPDSDTVSPAGGSGEFFVGSVDASEFATFELSSSVSNGTDTLPIELTYIVDDERVTMTQTIDISTAGSSSPDPSQDQPAASSTGDGSSGSLGLPLIPLILGLFVVVGGSGVLYWLWNRE